MLGERANGESGEQAGAGLGSGGSGAGSVVSRFLLDGGKLLLKVLALSLGVLRATVVIGVAKVVTAGTLDR